MTARDFIRILIEVTEDTRVLGKLTEDVLGWYSGEPNGERSFGALYTQIQDGQYDGLIYKHTLYAAYAKALVTEENTI